MFFKCLDNLKSYADEELVQLSLIAFNFFKNKTISKDKITDNINSQIALSTLIRFFRSVNINKRIDEDTINSNLKDYLKNKPETIKQIYLKIKEIFSLQTQKINFSEKQFDNLNHFIYTNNKKNYIDNLLEENLKELTNFSWRINVTISNNVSNRVLAPEIYLFLSFDDGTNLNFIIDVKVFQEIRKSLANHIKKILENESVLLLK